MRCFLYKFQSIANTELIINEFDKNILSTATVQKVPDRSRRINMFCSLSCRVNTFYRQNTETNSCYKCFLLTKTKNIIQRKLNSWWNTFIEIVLRKKQSTIDTYTIYFSVCMVTRFWWWTVPKQDRSRPSSDRNQTSRQIDSGSLFLQVALVFYLCPNSLRH